MDKPEILVVEDESDAREDIANYFQAHGARVLLAANDKDALETYYRHASSIAAVVTDMRLRSKRGDDYTGGELGLRLKSFDKRLPVYCNSAIDVQSKFPFFEDYFVKGAPGSPRDIYEHVTEIVQRATAFEASRFSSVPEDLIALKDKYQISDGDFFSLVGGKRLSELERTALLLVHRWAEEESEPPDAAIESVSQNLTAANADIEFIAPDSPEADAIPLLRPVPVVIEKSEDVWIAELFGYPLIYTYADTKESAKVNLVSLLWDYRRMTIQEDEGDKLRQSVDLVRFGAFLRLLFT